VYVFSHCGKVKLFVGIARHTAFLCLENFRDIRRPGKKFWGDTGTDVFKTHKTCTNGIPTKTTSLFWVVVPVILLVVLLKMLWPDASSRTTSEATPALTHSPLYLQRILDIQLRNWNGVKRTEGGFRQCRSAPQTLCSGIDLTSCIERNCTGVTLSLELDNKSNGQSLRTEYDKHVDRTHS